MFGRGRKKGEVRANSNNTMTWKERTKKSRQSDMRESIFKTKTSLNAENMYQAVLLPDRPEFYVEDYNKEREEIHMWWAENTVDFYNELCVLVGVLTENNEEWGKICDECHKNPAAGYPRNVSYLWKASKEVKPKQLPVDVYVDHVLIWMNSQIENEEIFPTDEDVPFPTDFKMYAKKMFKRMFRVYAIFYANTCLYQSKVVENHLDTCFKHFMYFAWKWDLVDAPECACINDHIAPMKKKFIRDQKLYFEHKRPSQFGKEE